MTTYIIRKEIFTFDENNNNRKVEYVTCLSRHPNTKFNLLNLLFNPSIRFSLDELFSFAENGLAFRDISADDARYLDCNVKFTLYKIHWLFWFRRAKKEEFLLKNIIFKNTLEGIENVL